MIVFTTIRCSRLDHIASNGFEEQDDLTARCVTSDERGAGMIYCSDEPVTDGELPADFHVAYILDVPDDVLEQYVIVPGEGDAERSAAVGWLLPMSAANQYRGLCESSKGAGWPCAIDLDPNVSTPLANLEDVERDDAVGWMKIIGQAIRKRRLGREPTSGL